MILYLYLGFMTNVKVRNTKKTQQGNLPGSTSAVIPGALQLTKKQLDNSTLSSEIRLGSTETWSQPCNEGQQFAPPGPSPATLLSTLPSILTEERHSSLIYTRCHPQVWVDEDCQPCTAVPPFSCQSLYWVLN